MIVRQWCALFQWFFASAVVLGTCTLAMAQDPLVQWTFDESAGGTTDALDSGQAPATTGVLGSTATRTTDTPGGKPGFALDLSDANAAGLDTSIVDGGNPLEVDTLAQLTFSMWVKVTGETDYNDGGSANVRLLAKQGGGPLYDGFTWNITAPRQGEPRSNNAFSTGLFIGGQTAFAFSYATADILDRGGDWIFLAVSYDGNAEADNAKFYIGDETTPVAQLGDTVSILAGPVFSTNTSNGGAGDARFAIGLTDAAPTADTAITGYQDDVRVYGNVLDLAALEAVRLANLPSISVLTGDYSDNGVVDAADYTVWRDALGTSTALPNEDLSVTPGMVTDEDYGVWKTNFGNANASGAALSAQVPEPSALVLLGLGLIAPVLHRRAHNESGRLVRN